MTFSKTLSCLPFLRALSPKAVRVWSMTVSTLGDSLQESALWVLDHMRIRVAEKSTEMLHSVS